MIICDRCNCKVNDDARAVLRVLAIYEPDPKALNERPEFMLYGTKIHICDCCRDVLSTVIRDFLETRPLVETKTCK